MIHVVLHQPDIPHNTGNIVRLCANAGVVLHLVEPLGFSLDDKRLRRARLDYAEMVRVQRHADWSACRAVLSPGRIFAVETTGQRSVFDLDVAPGDAFVFGSESRGLPAALLAAMPAAHVLHLPMRPRTRSLNLSNAVAITVFEAWRQLGFAGSEAPARGDSGLGFDYCAEP